MGEAKKVVWLLKVVAMTIISIAVVVVEGQPEANFKCNTDNTTTCRALTDYTYPNATTLGEIKTLFNIKHLPDLLGANNLPSKTNGSYTVPANQVIKIPFTCKCNNGTGRSNHTPRYKIKPGDGLDEIARVRFAGLVKYQQIQTANNIKDANNITAGDTLWIPLPCSCDTVEGNSVVHYAHIVGEGTSVESIAQQYGTTQQILLSVNGIDDPKTLQAGQLLDVPLPVCNSSVRSDSLDFPLLVPNATYVYTAHECVKCKCDSSNNNVLECEPSQLKPINNWSVCPSMECSGNVFIGNTTSTATTDSCTKTVCGYAGFTSRNISTVVSTQNTCPPAVAPTGSGDSGSGASKVALHGWVWNNLLILILFFAYLL